MTFEAKSTLPRTTPVLVREEPPRSYKSTPEEIKTISPPQNNTNKFLLDQDKALNYYRLFYGYWVGIYRISSSYVIETKCKKFAFIFTYFFVVVGHISAK